MISSVDLTNVVEVKEQKSPEFTCFESFSRTRESIAPQAVEIHACFKIHPHVPRGDNRWTKSFSHFPPPPDQSPTLMNSRYICGPAPRTCSRRRSKSLRRPIVVNETLNE